jgi:hypothetical protein
MSPFNAPTFLAAVHAAVALSATVATPVTAQRGASVNRSAPREVVTQFAFGMGADLSPMERRAVKLAPIRDREIVTAARDRLLGHPAFFVKGEVGEDTTLWQETMFVFLLPQNASPWLLWSMPVREFTVGRDSTASYDVTSCVFVIDDSTLVHQLFVDPLTARIHPRVAALLARSGVYHWRAPGASGAAGRFDQVGPVNDSTRRECEESPMRDPD